MVQCGAVQCDVMWCGGGDGGGGVLNVAVAVEYSYFTKETRPSQKVKTTNLSPHGIMGNEGSHTNS